MERETQNQAQHNWLFSLRLCFQINLIGVIELVYLEAMLHFFKILFFKVPVLSAERLFSVQLNQYS